MPATHLAPGNTVYTPAAMYGSRSVGTATIVTVTGTQAHIRMRGKMGTLTASTAHLFATRAEAAAYWSSINVAK